MVKNASGTQEATECGVGDERVPDLREYFGGTEPEFLKSRTVLLVPGKITFNRELYLGLKEENHNAEITLVLLKDEVFDPVSVIIGSCIGGLLLLAFIILLLWKCGFFKRNYKTMMEQEGAS
ncbi:integrin alpha-E-like isoform 2-T2 [Sarcoramphus papa]